MVLTAFQFDSVGLSEIGHVRGENQDVQKIEKHLGLFLLADGMGGREGGKLAATLAVDSFHDYCKRNLEEAPSTSEQVIHLFTEAYRLTNESVFNEGQTASLMGMGTTLCALLFLDDKAIISHVGDSRIYLFRKNRLACLTEDHTLLNEALQGLTPEEKLPSKHILSRAIGPLPTVTPSIEVCPVKKGDLFLVCSDGLSNSLEDREVEDILAQGGECAALGDQLMQAALVKGGQDNVTFIVVKISDQS